MDHRQVVRILSVARGALGVALLVAPGAVGRRWLGEVADDRAVRAALRGVGARDLALGVGALQALDQGQPAEAWVRMATVGDVTDAAAALLASRRLGPARTIGTVALAGGSAALGLQAAARLDD